MTSSPDLLSVERFVPAPPAAVFDLLVDPAKHAEIDGGDTVVAARSGGRRLGLGDRFGMDMHLGTAYSTLNTVVEFEQDHRIAWQTTATGLLSKVLGGRIWRYVLEPVDGGTKVTETWDIRSEATTSKPFVRGMRSMTRRNMERTLARIEEILAGEKATDEAQPPAAT
ncbi:SRPBCC family protein [Oryzobacter telluris]|uniref:SRPBCC family protein n=1 Tax=Oryzobacter telluris TaxID=3149179 RepID=UPI00370D72DF